MRRPHIPALVSDLPPSSAQFGAVDDWLREPEAPIVLPFCRMAEGRSTQQAAAGFPPGSAADMLLSGGGAISDNIFFLQLPPDLPTSAAPSMVPVPAKDDPANPRDFGNRCKELGSGSLGKMRLHKSGRVTFRLGEVSYEVRVGTDCACAQELMALSAEQCCSLGEVRSRMLCVPSIEALIASVGSAGGSRGVDVKPNVHSLLGGSAGGSGVGTSPLGGLGPHAHANAAQAQAAAAAASAAAVRRVV